MLIYIYSKANVWYIKCKVKWKGECPVFHVLITWNYFMQSMILNINGKERRIQSGIIVNISAVAAVALLWNENLGDRKKDSEDFPWKKKNTFLTQKINLMQRDWEVESNKKCKMSGQWTYQNPLTFPARNLHEIPTKN